MARNLEQLNGFIAGRTAVPFAWGRRRQDCVAFVFAGYTAATGRVLLPRVTWSTERGAARVIRRRGGLEAAFDGLLPAVAPAEALRGDVGAIADPRFGITLVLIEGASWVAPGARGLRRGPRAELIRAWSIDE